MPALLCRRNSRYADSTARSVAIRSGTWSSAPQARHHSRISPSAGGCTPCSILLTRVKCCPVAVARARPVSPASLRSSRRRTPRASWACLAVLYGFVFTVWDGQPPDGIEGRATQPDVGRVGGDYPVNGCAVARIEQKDNESVVEQVEVVARNSDRRD